MTTDGQGKARPRATTLLLAMGYGGVLFILTFVLLGFLAPGYNSLRDSISALELTPLHLAQQINFFLFGVLLALFSLGLHREMQAGFGATLIPIFQFLAGLGVIGDAIFLQPAPHMACDILAFNASLCVLFLFAWRHRRDPRWRGWSTFSVATAIAMMALLFGFGMADHLGGPAGLIEKLATSVRTLWSVLLVTRLLAGSSLTLSGSQ
jgi:hypothetical protein